MKDILTEWIQQGVRLQTGEELYIPTAHKHEQKDFFRDLRGALKTYKEIDPVGGSQIRIFLTYKDKLYWVVMKKVNVSPLIGWKKGVDGRLTRVLVQSRETDRIERLKLLDQKGE